MNKTCPSAIVLKQLLDQLLADAERQQIELHIETCKACQHELDALSGTSHLMTPLVAQQSAVPPPDALARWLTPLVATPVEPGSTIGPFRIEAILGRGGMGVVYRATDTVLGRVVALKVLHAAFDSESAARFVREIQAAARVQHDHIVQVFSAVESKSGPVHFVMELVEGQTLRQAIATPGGLDARRAAEILAQVADAVAAIHAAGWIHRDIKPANILLAADTGRAKLTDFGLARLTMTPHHTRSGMLIGTPAYMAPEQVRDSTNVDALADVYGLGATLYEGLTGVEPFRGELELILAQVLADDPIPPHRLNPSVPRDLDTICMKAMSKDPASRYANAAALRDDLRRWLAGEPIVAKPMNAFDRLRRWTKRNRTVAALACSLAASVLFAFGLITWQWLRADANAQQARESASVALAEKMKADQDFLRAEQVINLFYQTLYEKGTVAAAVDIPTRLELIKEAIAFYEESAARRPGQQPAAELAAAYARKGVLHNILRETKQATACFQQSLELFERAELSEPANPKRQRDHAECRFYLGVSAGRSVLPGEAMIHYEAAVKRLTPLAATDPQASYYLAGSLGNLAGVYEYLGKIEKARAMHEQALPVHRQARMANPLNGGALQDLIWTTLTVARLHPDAKTGVDQLIAARSLIDDYIREQPADYNRSDVECSYFIELADAHLRAGRPQDALEAAEAARPTAKALATYPPQFRHEATQAAAWHVLAMAYATTGEQDAAVNAWTKSAELLDALGWKALTLAQTKDRLARIYDSLAGNATTKGDTKAVDGFRKRAIDTRARLKKEHPEFKPGG